MRSGTRHGAVVFDLDDTLHRERRFILSGFLAVSREVERRWGVPRTVTGPILVRALRRGERARAFQVLCDSTGLPERAVPDLVDVVRRHIPSLRLPRASASVLEVLRPRWRLGILTNGLPFVQAAKVAALGLDRLVDAVVLAETVVPGGKPAAGAFGEVLRQLGVDAARAWFVGDDVERDVKGARSAGLRAVWLRPRGAQPMPTPRPAFADAVIGHLTQLPAVLERAVDGTAGGRR